MPITNNKALKINLPWLLIAMVLLCTVISYYMVHYQVYKTFLAKMVKLDNLYIEGLAKANKHLLDVHEQLKAVNAEGCSDEMVNTLRTYILTSNEQEIVWLKFTDEALICSALGVSSAFGPHYYRILESNELGLDIYQQAKGDNLNATEPIYVGKLTDKYRLFVGIDAVQDMLATLVYCRLCGGLNVLLPNNELLRFNMSGEEADLIEFKSTNTELVYRFRVNSEVKQLLRLHYFFISMISLTLMLLVGFLLKGIISQVLLNRQFSSALKKEQFYLVYQPVVNTSQGNVLGVEALLRWRDPDGNTKNTASFIGDLELSPLMPKVTRWVVKTALTELSNKLGGEQLTWCSINISAKEVEQGHMGVFLEELASEGYPVHYLSFELTERLPISDWDKLKEFIRVCQELGCQIELDDVGTGYGGNLWLQNLDFDYLKIDQQFVSRLGTPGSKLSLIKSYIAIAEEFDISVIAEGVETQEQADMLTELGVNLHQGWLYSKAVAADELKLGD